MHSKKLSALLIKASLLVLILVEMAHGESVPPLTHKLTAVDKVIMAPLLRFQNMDEKIVDIKDFRGKTVVVNFWATWCPPCRREMGSLERLHRATKDKNVVVLAVNIGEDFDTVFSFLGLIETYPEYEILFDSDAQSMKLWNVNGLPTTYVIQPDGRVVYRAVGGREFDHPSIIKKLIGLNVEEKAR